LKSYAIRHVVHKVSNPSFANNVEEIKIAPYAYSSKLAEKGAIIYVIESKKISPKEKKTNWLSYKLEVFKTEERPGLLNWKEGPGGPNKGKGYKYKHTAEPHAKGLYFEILLEITDSYFNDWYFMRKGHGMIEIKGKDEDYSGHYISVLDKLFDDASDPSNLAQNYD
jgi:hypothetical protein